MRIYVHQTIVKTVSTDPNPDSVAASLGGLIDGAAGFLAAETASAGNKPRMAVIPDEPEGSPEDYDAWMNDYINPALA